MRATVLLLCCLAGAGLAACSGERSAPDTLDRVLLLGLSVFPVGPDGKASREPGPATLVILRREAGRWAHETIEDPESNVFHKALPFTPPGGEPGLLTIAGNAARLKLWRKRDGVWAAETLWAPEFGGAQNRLRDMELADLDGDGRTEIVLATHDQGVVAVLTASPEGVAVHELDRVPQTFVHEVEVGDVDGDGRLEIYATPSQPNRFDGDLQTGRVMRYRPEAAEAASLFADLGARHAKEILVADLDGDDRPEVYASVEGRIEEGRLVAPVEIRRYTGGPDAGRGETVAQLSDHLCRVLVAADVDGDGRREMVAAPFKAGLWLLRPGPMPWAAQQIDADSSGFEHAAAAFDLDGDGRDEIYVAADEQGAVRRYVWRDSSFAREEIFRPGPELHGFTWNITTAPAELTR